MKVGDVVKVMPSDAYDNYLYQAGQVGIIVGKAKRIHVVSFKVLLKSEVFEFDHDELEVIK